MSLIDDVIEAPAREAVAMISDCESEAELLELIRYDKRASVVKAVERRIRKIRRPALPFPKRGASSGIQKQDAPEIEVSPPTTEDEIADWKLEKTCPKCGKTGEISESFGYRVMTRTKKSGEKVQTKKPQSYCKRCRVKVKPSEE